MKSVSMAQEAQAGPRPQAGRGINMIGKTKTKLEDRRAGMDRRSAASHAIGPAQPGQKAHS
jgi:hypothetical protein